jgi:hypothetical protein
MIEQEVRGKKGKLVKIWLDDCDRDLLEDVWYVIQDNFHHTPYVVKHDKSHIIKLHRVIARRMFGEQAVKGKVVDHIDGNGVNNVRANLRLATNKENSRNARKPSHNTTGYKGVSFYPDCRTGPWRACLSVDNKTVHLGGFSSAEDAAKAYDQAARKHYGEFARLNFE